MNAHDSGDSRTRTTTTGTIGTRRRPRDRSRWLSCGNFKPPRGICRESKDLSPPRTPRPPRIGSADLLISSEKTQEQNGLARIFRCPKEIYPQMTQMNTDKGGEDLRS